MVSVHYRGSSTIDGSLALPEEETQPDAHRKHLATATVISRPTSVLLPPVSRGGTTDGVVCKRYLDDSYSPNSKLENRHQSELEAPRNNIDP